VEAYLALVRDVLADGVPKHPVRFDSHVTSGGGKPTKIEIGTTGLPCRSFQHDMRRGFPLLTTKEVNFSTVCVELEAFIKGVTDKRWFHARGVRIWDQWCPPADIPESVRGSREETESFMRRNNNLGVIYGAQWRDFAGTGYDQLKTICDRLRENPYDRRMVCSAWVPHMIPHMALPPCHYAFVVIVYGDTISLTWKQRSCDLMLGVPFNIASYAMLLELLAKHAGLRPWLLKGDLDDCHIYDNQLQLAKLQAGRRPRELPAVEIPGGPDFNIFDWTHEQVTVRDYHPHPPIKFEKALAT